MATKKNQQVVKSEDDTLRNLLLEKEALYEEIKQNGGEIPASFDKNAEAIAAKIDDYGFVNEFFKREIANIENEVAPFQKVVNIGKAKIKNLEAQLKRFKEFTCDLVEQAGEAGGRDGKKRLMGHNFWIKSLQKEDKILKENVVVPEEYKTAIVELPYEDYMQFYSHLKLRDVEISKDLPDEFFEKVPKKNVQFYENTQQELKDNG